MTGTGILPTMHPVTSSSHFFESRVPSTGIHVLLYGLLWDFMVKNGLIWIFCRKKRSTSSNA